MNFMLLLMAIFENYMAASSCWHACLLSSNVDNDGVIILIVGEVLVTFMN